MDIQSRFSRWALGLACLALLTVTPAPVAAQLSPGGMPPSPFENELLIEEPRAPTFVWPQLAYIPGVGFEIDTGGPGYRIEFFDD